MLIISPSFGSFRAGEPIAYEVGKKYIKKMVDGGLNLLTVEEGILELNNDTLTVTLIEIDGDTVTSWVEPFVFEVVRL